MKWEEVVAHPSLRDLPFKIELNEYGAVVMNPVKPNHSVFQGEIAYLLRSMDQTGRVSAELALWTRKGTKVTDVAWMSLETWQEIKGKTEALVAPKVCVKVLSMSNSDYEIKEKRKLYFEQGAKEVWICDEYGNMTFYNPKRKLAKSAMFPEFPKIVKI